MHFVPGSDEPVVRTFTQDEVIEEISTKYGPSLEERANTTTMRLSQCEDEDYREYDLGEHEDTAALTRDGEKLVVNLGTRRFISRALEAKYNQVVDARIRRNTKEIVLRVTPGPDFENHKILPFQRVQYSNQAGDIVDQKFIVLRRVMNRDWSMTFTLLAAPDGRFTADHTLPLLPGYPQIPVNPPATISLPVPTAPVIRKRVFITPEGNARVLVIFDFAHDGHFHVLKIWEQIRTADNNATTGDLLYWREINTLIAYFDAPKEGTFEYELRTRDPATLRVSAPFSGNFMVSFDTANLPGALVYQGAQRALGLLQISVTGITNIITQGVELRGYHVPLGSTSTDPLVLDTEAKWASAPRIASDPIIPNYGGDSKFSLLTMFIPVTGRYHIFGRIVTNTGRQGPISDLRTHSVSATITEGGPLPPLPPPPEVPTTLDWRGTINNMAILAEMPKNIIVLDFPRLNISFLRWNGEEGWPFGSLGSVGASGAPFFQQQWLNISPTASLQVRAKVDWFIPPGTVASRYRRWRFIVECGYRGPGATSSAPEVSGKVTLENVTHEPIGAIDRTITTPWVSLPGTITYIAGRVTLATGFAGIGFTGLTLETRLGS